MSNWKGSEDFVAPQPIAIQGGFEPNTQSGGLTKRELFAAMAMQGLIASRGAILSQPATDLAVDYADALIAELSRTSEGEMPGYP